MSFPTTGVIDDFNRTTGVGANWTAEPFNDGSPLWSIVTNAADGGGGTDAWYNASSFANTGGLEIWATIAKLPSVGNFNGWWLGLVQQPSGSSSTADGYQVGFTHQSTGDKVGIFRYDNSVETQLGSTVTLGTGVYTVGDTIGFELKTDGTINVYRNGTNVATTTSTTYFHAGQSAFLEMSLVAVTSGTHTQADSLGGGQTVATGGTQTLSVGKAAGAKIAQEITVSPSGHATVGVGKTAVLPSVKGATLAAAGHATIAVGGISGALTAKGVTPTAIGTATVSAGRVNFTATVHGVTVHATGLLVVTVGKASLAATPYGASLSSTGIASIRAGRISRPCVVPGVTLSGSGIAALHLEAASSNTPTASDIRLFGVGTATMSAGHAISTGTAQGINFGAHVTGTVTLGITATGGVTMKIAAPTVDLAATL